MEMKLTYIAIRTVNSERMKDFYVKYLGAVVEEACPLPHNSREENKDNTNPDSCLVLYNLSFKGGIKMKLIPEPQLTGRGYDPMPVRSPYSVQLTFRVGSRKRVNELTCRLLLEGHEVINEPGYCGVKCYSSSIYDPEGNIIELVA